MSALPESGVFFCEDIVNLDLERWKIKKLASCGKSLVDGNRGLYVFIESDGRQKNHFLMTIGSTRNDPLFTYNASIISRYKSLKLLCRFIKE
jgi:hypothetical protein